MAATKAVRRAHPEADEQTALFQWAALMRGRLPGIELMYHVPNGGSRHPAEAARLKAQGVKAGVPDICLPVPQGEKHGLYIELKAGKGKPTEKQKAWIAALREQGYAAGVCHGWRHAASVICRYYGEETEDDKS